MGPRSRRSKIAQKQMKFLCQQRDIPGQLLCKSFREDLIWTGAIGYRLQEMFPENKNRTVNILMYLNVMKGNVYSFKRKFKGNY